MEYKIREEIGENCITQEDGQQVYDKIYPLLLAQEDVILNFDGVRIVASPFLNSGIGQLLRDLTPETLNAHLKFLNLNSITLPVLRRVIENAKQYYSDPDFRRTLETALETTMSDNA